MATSRTGVNALTRAFLISTLLCYVINEIKDTNCVNALTRAFLISTILCRCSTLSEKTLCQCPISGFPHFYPASLEPAI